jgi:23S rRNA pseudouridine955/2504/2580 synthase/23S rRNA pseudouridine1911/1915/1917 synthase
VAGKVDLDVLEMTEDYVAVNKPAGMATIPGRGEDDSVLERLGRQIGLASSGVLDPRVRVVHRLDKDTSGVLLFAKNVETQRHLSEQFQNNRVEKQYLALVSGRPGEREGEIDAPLAPHPGAARRMAVVKYGGRPARSVWKVEEVYRQYTLLRVFPKTGKTHQIRVHLKHIGVPLAIDPVYNAPRTAGEVGGIMLSGFKRGYRVGTGEKERPLIGRLTLHAEKLAFVDRAGKQVVVVAALPKDFRAVLNMLGKYGR